MYKNMLQLQAAVGLCVGVGSFSDPWPIQGLAHFLEHMVFMGSEKYPKENDFDAFLRVSTCYIICVVTCIFFIHFALFIQQRLQVQVQLLCNCMFLPAMFVIFRLGIQCY